MSDYNQSIAKARMYSDKEKLIASFAVYASIFRKYPNLKKRLEQEFQTLLRRLNSTLIFTEDERHIFAYLKTALHYFPTNIYALTEMGRFSFKYNLYHDSLCYLESALEINPRLISIERNMNIVKKFLISGHYYKSLNDVRKNAAYRRAIQQTVTPAFNSVLDLDSRVGLLAIYASEAQADLTIAFNSPKENVQLTQQIVNENQLEYVLVLNREFGRLNNKHLIGEKTLVLTDMFDPGLFGDHVLQSLAHAWQELLSCDCTVLPSRAEYFVMGVRSENLKNKYQMNKPAKNLLAIPTKKVLSIGQTYESEDISNYHDIEYVTEPASLFTINFNSYHDIRDKLANQESYPIKLKAIDTGEVSTVVGWFELHLTDDITISNDPRVDERVDAWPQAVFYDYIPKQIKEGDVIPLQFIRYRSWLGLLTDMTDVVKISAEIVKFLNDTEYVEAITGSLAMNCVYLGQTVDIADTDIIDLSPFPIFGFEMLKRGARSLVCHAKNTNDKMFLERVFHTNNIAHDKYSVMMHELWTDDSLRDKQFHVIFCTLLDANGDIDVQKRKLTKRLSHAHSVHGGLSLPMNMVMYGQIISSEELEKLNMVRDENIGGYRIAKVLNRYKLSSLSNIDVGTLNYTALSEVAVLSSCWTDTRVDILKVPIVQDGRCSGVLCWYGIIMSGDTPVKFTNSPDSFADCVAYMVKTPMPVQRGAVANVIRCVDENGTVALSVDIDY